MSRQVQDERSPSTFTGEESETIAAARMLAINRMPYLATLLFEVRLVRAVGLGTFAVDRHWRLYLDPERLATWGPTGTASVLMHEVHHLLRGHVSRRDEHGASDAFLWNVAADAEINDDLIAAGWEFPQSPVIPKSLGAPTGLLAEQYYDLLDSGTGATSSVRCGSGSGGETIPEEIDAEGGIGPADQLVIRRKVALDITKAHNGGTSMPGGLLRWSDRTLRPSQLPWDVLLRAAVRRAVAVRAGQADFRYSRPGRRRVPRLVTPSMVQPDPCAMIIIDTSASMDHAALEIALGEVNSICRRASAGTRDANEVVTADVAITGIQRARDTRRIELAGGGGTDMANAIHQVVARRPRPDVLVVLTDGETGWPARKPAGIRIIVVVINRNPAPARAVPAWAVTVSLNRGQLSEAVGRERQQVRPSGVSLPRSQER